MLLCTVCGAESPFDAGSSHSQGGFAMSARPSRWMPLRYPGKCHICGQPLPAGATAYWDAVAHTVTCFAIDCADADGLTVQKPLTGPWDKRTDLRVRTDKRVAR